MLKALIVMTHANSATFPRNGMFHFIASACRSIVPRPGIANGLLLSKSGVRQTQREAKRVEAAEKAAQK
jgi:hypothetical protein